MGLLPSTAAHSSPRVVGSVGGERSFVERLAACGDPAHAPAELAELVRLTFRQDPQAKVLRDALQAVLFKWTLRHAVERTRFYRQPVYERCLSANGEQERHLLPVLQRADVIENLLDIHAEGLTFGAITHTSGCTGPSLPVYRSKEELAFLWDYHSQLIAPLLDQDGLRPLTLSLPNLYHGTPLRVPSLGQVFLGGVTDDLILKDTIGLLLHPHRVAGHEAHFSTITGLVHQLLFLTSSLYERGIDPGDLGVKTLSVVGGFLTERCRTYLADSWGATVLDRFSLTESAGGATRCLSCGLFHLDPHVLGEVLDVDSNEPLETGIGRLVLTELYPFVQLQPFLRYATGDLVECRPGTCVPGLTFEFIGKEQNCLRSVFDDRSEWLIMSTELYDTLDPFPDFPRVEQFRGVRSSQDPSVGSLPLYTLESSGEMDATLRILLTLELRFSPNFYRERVGELRRAIQASLVRRRPVLGERIQNGTVQLTIKFVGPRQLPSPGILKV